MGIELSLDCCQSREEAAQYSANASVSSIFAAIGAIVIIGGVLGMVFWSAAYNAELSSGCLDPYQMYDLMLLNEDVMSFLGAAVVVGVIFELAAGALCCKNFGSDLD